MAEATRPRPARKTRPAATRKQPNDKLRRPRVTKASPTGPKPPAPESLNLFCPGNRKLGPEIHTWSLPAVTTCPGATAACLAVCYARRGAFRYRDVQARYARNLELSRTDSFVTDAIEEIHDRQLSVIRLHVSGDLYSRVYTRKLIRIARACPSTAFFLYTRSWRTAGFREPLRQLAALENVQLWLSADSVSGRPPTIAGTRIAYMATTADEEANVPAWADLVFRDPKHGPAKWINTAKTCVYEDGVARKVGKIGCSKCGICLNPPKSRRSQSFGGYMDAPASSVPVPVTSPV